MLETKVDNDANYKRKIKINKEIKTNEKDLQTCNKDYFINAIKLI